MPAMEVKNEMPKATAGGTNTQVSMPATVKVIWNRSVHMGFSVCLARIVPARRQFSVFRPEDVDKGSTQVRFIRQWRALPGADGSLSQTGQDDDDAAWFWLRSVAVPPVHAWTLRCAAAF